MENVILVIHLILALSLIGVVLLQRSEGGGLGMGGGGGGGGAMSARGAATAMGRVTWILAAGFIATSVTLTILSAKNAANGSVITGTEPAPASAPALPGNLTLPTGTDFGTGPDTGAETPAAPNVDDLMPPTPEEPTPPRAD